MIPLEPWRTDASEVLRALGGDPERGLSTEEAARRRIEAGPNELISAPPVPAWRRLLGHLRSPLTYLLLAAIGISLAAWFADGAHGWPTDPIVISLIVVANVALGYAQEERAERAVAALARLTAPTSSVRRDGRRRRIPTVDLVPGDLLELAEGDSVGADARLVDAVDLRVAEASLTGESEPVDKDPATLRDPVPLGDRDDMVFKGTAVTQGVGRAVVTATGMATEMGRIAELLRATAPQPTPLSREISRLGRTLGLAVVGIAIVIVVTILAVSDIRTTSDTVGVLLLGVSLAVAAVPEGLPAILSVVLAIGVQRMARRNAIVKELASVETLGSASVICSDKTGTLTKSEMTVVRIVTASGCVELRGGRYEPGGDAAAGDGSAPVTEAQLLLTGGGLANNASLEQVDGGWAVHGDPTEAAFLIAGHRLEGTVERLTAFTRVGEVPFSSSRKLMSTLQRGRDGAVTLFTKGAPEVLLPRCTRLQVGDQAVPLDEGRRAAALAQVDELSAGAFRTLAVAYRPADERDRAAGEGAERDLVYVGVAAIIDPPRDEAAHAVGEARRAGIRVIVITGDHPLTGARIAADLGIIDSHGRAVTGLELDRLDEPQLRETVRDVSVFARVAPEHKLRIVEALQAGGQVVAMTGDGVNDAPALKAADIGVAMGITGTEVSKEAANMVLADDDFTTIVAAVREGRAIFENIRKFLRYLLSSNTGEVLTVFLGVVLSGVIGLTAQGDAVVVPLLATQILWINLVTDSGPALAMGMDPTADDVMSRRPRTAADHAIDRRMWEGVVLVGLVMAVATLLALDLHLPGGLVEGGESLRTARTAGFTTLVLAQLFNCLSARSETASAFRQLFANRWLWAAIVTGALLQVGVVSLPALQAAFDTTSLTLGQWATCTALASAVLWAAELRKLVRRQLARARR